jgi:hypothetical protein
MTSRAEPRNVRTPISAWKAKLRSHLCPSSRSAPTPGPDFDNLPTEEMRIGELVTEHFIRDGVTLQAGIGQIPDAVIGTIKRAGYRDLGVQTELYGDGLMLLQKTGIVTNRKKSSIRDTAPPP